MRGRTLAVLFVTGLVAVGTAVAASSNGRWSAHLNSAQERPVLVDSQAQGQVIYQLSEDGTALHYKLIASNIENITQAHIHLRAADQPAGGIVVWLYPSSPPFQITLIPGRHDGILAEGTITASRFVGALAGKPFGDLLAALDSGLAYTNVHTTQNPPGEIRGDSR